MLNITPLKDDWGFNFGDFSFTLQVFSFSLSEEGFNSSGLNRKVLEIECAEREPHFFAQDPLKQFKRGLPITFTFNGKSYRFFISKTIVKGIFPNRLLSLVFSDIFEISQYNEAPFSLEKLGVCTGERVLKGRLIELLLKSSGIESEIDIPGSLQVALQKLSSESSIDLAGKIAYESGGYVLDYQSDGVVRAISYFDGVDRGAYFCEKDLVEWESSQNLEPPAKSYHFTGTNVTPNWSYQKPYKTFQRVRDHTSNATVSEVTKSVRYGGSILFNGNIRQAPIQTGLTLCKETTILEKIREKELGLGTGNKLVDYKETKQISMRNRKRQIVYVREECKSLMEKFGPSEKSLKARPGLMRPRGMEYLEINETFYDFDENGNIDRVRTYQSKARGLLFPSTFIYDTRLVLAFSTDETYTKKYGERYDKTSVQVEAVLKARYRYSGSAGGKSQITQMMADNFGVQGKNIDVKPDYISVGKWGTVVTPHVFSVGYETKVVPEEADTGDTAPPAPLMCDTDLLNDCGTEEPPVIEEELSVKLEVQSDYGITQNETYENLSLPCTSTDLKRYGVFMVAFSTESFNGRSMIMPPIRNTYLKIGSIVSVIERYLDGFYLYRCRVLNTTIEWDTTGELIAASLGVIDVSRTSAIAQNPTYDPSLPVSTDNNQWVTEELEVVTKNITALRVIETLPLKFFGVDKSHTSNLKTVAHFKQSYSANSYVYIGLFGFNSFVSAPILVQPLPTITSSLHPYLDFISLYTFDTFRLSEGNYTVNTFTNHRLLPEVNETLSTFINVFADMQSEVMTTQSNSFDFELTPNNIHTSVSPLSITRSERIETVGSVHTLENIESLATMEYNKKVNTLILMSTLSSPIYEV